MSVLTRNRSFFLAAGLILLAGLVIFASAIKVYGLVGGPGVAANVDPLTPNYNAVDSFGLTGMKPLTITPTDETPKFIKQPLAQKRGVILLVYVPGAGGDESMRASFAKLKLKYADSASFFAFEQRDVKSNELGDVLAQLGAVSPPLLAIIRGDGKVSQLYTGWIDELTMEQQISNAVRY